jgi:hypothetical protein
VSKLIEKPERPLDNECCGGGACQPCVWDYYFEQMELWQKQQDELEKESKLIEEDEKKAE